MAIPIIYKGDDTDFNGGAPITLNIETAFDLSGCRIELSFLGCRREFSGLSGHTATLSVVFSSAETAAMPVGTHCATLRAYDSAGRVRTLTDSVRLRVTDSVDEAAGGSVDVGVGETVEELTPTDGLGAVKEVVNKLARLVGASCIAIALCGATSLNDMPGTNTIYTAAETDAKIVELAPAPGNYATVSNRAMSAIQEHQTLEPSTNYTDAALAEFARTNKVLKAGPYIPTAGGTATNTVTVTTGGPAILEWARPWSSLERGAISFGDNFGGWTFDSSGLHRHIRTPFDITLGGAFTFPADAYETGGELALRSDIPNVDMSAASNYTDAVAGQFESGTRSVQYANNSGHTDYAVQLYNEDASGLYNATDLIVESTNAAKSVATPISNLVETVRAESALVYRLYQGSNVVAEVTNYNSSVHAPELRIMQLNESNEYFTVWAETNGLARTLASARQYTDDATNALPATFAPRAWGRTTSGLGFDAPEGMTWVSTSNLVIAGGLEYEKHVTSGGAIWLLESNGMTADFHASGNNTAYLDISAADGTSIFRIEKTDAFLVGVNVDNVSVEGSTLVCGVNVVASEHPLVRVKEKLTDASWAKEEDGIPASLATVTWSGSAGNWTCRIQNNTGGNSFFAQMEYLQEGGTKIVNTAPIDVTPGILCTDGIHKVRPVYSNGNITWEVVP